MRWHAGACIGPTPRRAKMQVNAGDVTDVTSAPPLVGVLLLPPRKLVNNGSVGGLRPTTGVEDQRMLSPTPGAAVVQAPKRDALDDILVLHEDGEEFCVISCLLVTG